ncbi:MAG: phosphoribosyl transferase [Parachlamydiaceae bacterium]|nr:phosphoribosyl transferase [Parachlamydiaceae bacterium]
MVYFKDRRDAGKQLGHFLEKYKDHGVIVYGLPRGGVVVAEEVANFLHAPLDLIFAHKIGHPYQPEYAIAAVSESGHLVGASYELLTVGDAWLDSEKKSQLEQMQRRRSAYLGGKLDLPIKDKVAIIVDDGIATGLTMQVAIKELQGKHPKKIVVAVPVVPLRTAHLIQALGTEVVAVEIPEDYKFLGAVGAYYDEFYQVEDQEVISILMKFHGKAHP